MNSTFDSLAPFTHSEGCLITPVPLAYCFAANSCVVPSVPQNLATSVSPSLSSLTDTSFSPPYNNAMISSQEYSNATIEQCDPSKAPILLPGILTPQVCVDLYIKFENLFQVKGTANEVQVAMVTSSLQDAQHSSWFQANECWLLTLSLEEFFSKFKKTFLPLDWERTMWNSILNKPWTHAYITDSRLAGGSAPGPLAASQH